MWLVKFVWECSTLSLCVCVTAQHKNKLKNLMQLAHSKDWYQTQTKKNTNEKQDTNHKKKKEYSVTKASSKPNTVNKKSFSPRLNNCI